MLLRPLFASPRLRKTVESIKHINFMRNKRSMEILLIEWLRPFDAVRTYGKDVVERSSDGWVEVRKDNKTLHMRSHQEYVVIVHPWFSKDEKLFNEVVEALSVPIESAKRFIDEWESSIGDWSAELEISSNGILMTPYTKLQWFHGQEDVNKLLEKHNSSLIMDYDGVTRAEVRIGRPITAEKVDEGLRKLVFLLRLYAIIEKVQTAEAIRITIQMLPHNV